MKKQNKVAVASFVASGKAQLVVLRPFEHGLILHTMYYADEVRDFTEIEGEEGAVREKEVQLAEKLIDELTEKTFNPMQFHDDYRKRLLERIREKARGKAITAEEKPEEEKGGEVIDIMEALRRSLGGGTLKPAPHSRKAPRRAATHQKAASRAKTTKRRNAA